MRLHRDSDAIPREIVYLDTNFTTPKPHNRPIAATLRCRDIFASLINEPDS